MLRISTGIRLKNGGSIINIRSADLTPMFEKVLNSMILLNTVFNLQLLLQIHSKGARFALCVLVSDVYGEVKLAANTVGLTTQCVKGKNVFTKTPSGFGSNLVLKVCEQLFYITL